MKRFISILLVLTLSLGLLGGASLSAFADEGVSEEIVAAADTDDTPAAEAPAPEAEPAAQEDTDIPAEVEVIDQGEEPEETTETAEVEEVEEVEAPAEATETETAAPAEAAEPAQDGETVSTLTSGSSYVIGIEKDGKFYAMSNNGDGTVKAVVADLDNPADSIVWTVTESTKNNSTVYLFTNNGQWLQYGSKSDFVEVRTSGNAPSNWSYKDGTLTYDKTGTKYTVGDISGDSFTCGTSVTAANIVFYAVSGAASNTDPDPDPDTDPDNELEKDDDSGSGFNQVSKVAGLGGGSTAALFVDVDGNPLFVSDSGVVSCDSMAQTLTGTAGSYNISTDKPNIQWTVTEGNPPYLQLALDDKGTTKYLYITDDGVVTATTTAGDYAYWNNNEGTSLSYKAANGTVYYIATMTTAGVTTTTDASQALTLYTLTGTATTGTGGGGDKPDDSSSDTTDEKGPTFVTQPTAAPYVIEGDYAAPTYSATAQRPDGAAKVTSITFQWFVGDDDHPITNPVEIELDENGQATSTVSPAALQGLSYGVYLVYCKATCARSDGDHSNNSNKVSFIVTKGVQDNTFLTFSDVHQSFTNISYAINDTISVYGGFIPALIICTGDWANGYYSEFKASSDEDLATFKQTTYNDYILRMAAMVGGIDIVYVAGNHDNASAAEQANEEAGLGYNGSGLIYDNTTDNSNLVSSANSDDLVVFGINYTEISVDGGFSYVNVIPRLTEFLQGLVDKDYDGVVVISAHAGLHALTKDEMSDATMDGDNDYNIDLSDDMVTLLNEYAGKGLTIMFLFGHDHSKGESEFSKVAGDTIVSYHNYKAGTTTKQEVKFAYYGHSGYITNTIGGKEKYTVVEYEGNSILSLEGEDAPEDNDLRTKIAGKDTVLPEENVWYAVADKSDAASNYLNATLSTSGDDLLTAVSVDDTIKAAATAGTPVDVTLTSVKLNLSDTDLLALQDAVAKLGDQAKDLKYGAYMDLTLAAAAGDDTSAISQTSAPVSITITIPDNLYKSNYSYKIVRYHEGEATVITPKQDGKTLTFETDQFSTYVLVYEEAPVANPASPAKDNKSDPNAKGGRSPKTGDDSSITLWAVVLLSCTVGAVALVPKTKKH